LHLVAWRRMPRSLRISKPTAPRGLTARLAMLLADGGGFVFPAGDFGCSRLRGVAPGCTALQTTRRRARRARDRMGHPVRPWVRFAESIVRVNQRQLTSTGVNLCQPRGEPDRAVGSLCAGAISGTCGDFWGHAETFSSVARGHLGTSGARRRVDRTFGRIRDLGPLR
jgi:hypothetical protein